MSNIENETKLPQEDNAKKEKADSLIKKHTYTSIGLGLIPIPFVDFIGVAGIQANMVRKLANLYDVKFSQEAFKNSIGAIVGGAIPGVAGLPIASLMKTIPLVGQGLGVISMPVVAGASTYAIGKVFYRHFSTGGTFLTLDPDKVREYYKEQYKVGETVASQMMDEKKK